MSLLFSLLLCASGLIYAALLSLIFIGLFRLRAGGSTAQPSVSVIVAARDEQAHIGKCLSDLTAQTYPKDRYEVVVVDDRSGDRTGEIVRAFAREYPQVRFVRVDQCPVGVSPKKHAVKCGIEAGGGEIILSTDADSAMGPRWIEGMVRMFEPEVGLVAGLTEYDMNEGSRSIWQGLQALDFLSLSFCAAGSIGMGWAVGADANNLAYRRAAFEEVGGFRDVAHLVSGDDDLLVQQIRARTDWKIRFAISRETFVRTVPERTWTGFVHQRMRWASKGLHYRPSLVFFLGSTFLFYLLLFFSLPVSLLQGALFSAPVLCWIAKASFELLILAKGTSVFGRKGMLRFFLPAEVLHLPYVLSMAIGGHFFRFEWKGQITGKIVQGSLAEGGGSSPVETP
ncbi:MAG: glycosyltransferase [Candidatus Latescibacterota bacterium]